MKLKSTHRRRGFTLIEMVIAMILIGIALLPLASVAPLAAMEQVRHDRLERALVTAEAAMDQVNSIYIDPDKFDTLPMAWTDEGANNWSTFCDPATDATCRPVSCNPVTDPSCVPPKMIWRTWIFEDVTPSARIKKARVDVCLDLNDNDTCDEASEFLVRVNRLISHRCPDTLSSSACP